MPPAVPPGSNVFPEDVVELVGADGEKTYAVVTRCWADENPEAAAEAERLNIPYTPLAQGQLEVLHPNGQTTEVAESSITVVDRGFIRADVVRAAGGRGQAGICIKLETQVQLQRVLSGEVIEGTFDADEVIAAALLTRGDHVVWGSWVGMIEDVFEMAQVEAEGGQVRRVCDMGNTLSVGAAPDSFAERLSPIEALEIVPQSLKTILDVEQVVCAVNWLAMNQRTDHTHYERPKRYWSNDINELLLVRSSAEFLHSVGDKVTFRDRTRHAPSADVLTGPHSNGQYVFTITRTQTNAHVLWQDGTTTVQPATHLEHCVSIDDDVDVFPGDVGVFTGYTPPRVAVVQNFNSKKRTARLRWTKEGGEELVSGLEFDQHGPPPEVYGVRRQDHVLITKEGTTNGAEAPTVPRLGESEVLTGAFPPVEILRTELSSIGLVLARTMEDNARCPLPMIHRSDLLSINWYGEVQDLLLDGQVLVRFPSGETGTFPLDRLYHVDDGMTGGHEVDAIPGDENASMGSWETDSEGGAEGGEIMPGGWEEEDEPMEGWADEMDEDEEAAAGDNGLEVQDIILPEPEEEKAQPAEEVEKVVKAPVSMPAEIEDDENWKRFVMLEEAPENHHYAKEKLETPSKQYMARVQKEHKVLASSLPPNILVRAYEDRADLLRCLIIGPIGTPFANAPFLFDIYLPPTKFPQEPPQVFFHSWAGGTRVSPNLYAEGKVCLSLLNTWQGTATESWSSARSSLLQVVISIQGLIMVEQPYYTEPGFEKHEATLEGQAASDLYSERTLVLTRAFVKRACEYPPTNFEEEIKAYYYTGLPTTGPGALEGIVEQCKALLKESEEYYAQAEAEEEPEADDDVDGEGGEKKRVDSAVVVGQKVLTEGAGLSLKRTLVALEGLLTKKL